MRVLFVFLLLTFSSVAFAQSDPIRNYFDEMERLHQLNGNILLAENGKLVKSFSSGFADFKSKTKNTPETPFHLASVSKVITATAVLQLKDRNKFTLDQPVSRLLQGFPFSDITIRHLLTHTSGLPDLELFEELVKKFPDTIVTNQNVLPELNRWKRGLYFKPGDEYRYCNTEYNLLALIIEKASGMAYSSYLEKYIFAPAGMKSTQVAIKQTDNRLTSQPHMKRHPGYDSTFELVDSFARFKYLTYNNSGTTGQGNIVSTMDDMLRFDHAYFSGKLLKASSMQEAMSPLKLNSGKVYFSDRMDTMDGEGRMSYGLGWEIFEQNAFGKSVGHGGFKFGLATFYFHNLTNNQTIIAFDNTASSEFGRILFSTLSLLNKQPPLVFRTSKSLVTQYGKALITEGADHAAVIFHMNKSDTMGFYLNESEMNNLGYDLFYMSDMPGHREMALEVFKLGTFIFPNSFNTYDSYGQLLRDVGKTQDAIAMYKKSIQLNPDNEDGKRILKQIETGLSNPEQRQ